MLQPFQIMTILGFLPIFCCIQLFLVFQCIGISNQRKKVFWLIVIYTILFKAVEAWLSLMPAFDTSMSVQLTHSLVHAFNTFILLTIIAIYGNGYFPRNFIIVSFYYDMLSSLPFMPAAILTKVLGARFLPPDPGEYTDYPAGCAIMLVIWITTFLTIAAVYYLFGKKLNWLFSKIPDGICLIYFLLSFVAYISRQALLLTRSEYTVIHSTTGSYINVYLRDLSLGLLIIIALIVVLLARTAFHRRQLQKIQRLESTMLLDYYQNVSMLHGSIRSLRHDLSNHLAVPEEGYRAALKELCDQIDSQIRTQLSWQAIRSSQLSAREKYELYQYLQRLLRKHRLPPEALCIDAAENRLTVTIDTSGRRTIHPLLLRCSSFYRMLQIILKQHSGTATWQKGDHSCTLQLHF